MELGRAKKGNHLRNVMKKGRKEAGKRRKRRKKGGEKRRKLTLIPTQEVDNRNPIVRGEDIGILKEGLLHFRINGKPRNWRRETIGRRV